MKGQAISLPVSYTVVCNRYSKPFEIAWFVLRKDAEDFIKIQPDSDGYGIAEVELKEVYTEFEKEDN